MKKLSLILLTVLSITVVSCSGSLPSKMSRLADKVEAKGDKFSLDDWGKAAEKMESYVLQFADGVDSYKISEKAEVIKAVTRFSAKAVKCGAEEVLKDVDFDQLSNDAVNGADELTKSVKGFLEGLGL